MNGILETLHIKPLNPGAGLGTSDRWLETRGTELASFSPIDGQVIARVKQATRDDYEQVVEAAARAFGSWRMMPAPRRGQIIREIGERLREYKEPLGQLITLEMGKILSEGLGEVQEMIDMADFAVGQSRQLYGLTMPSERPEHRMFEQWHPLGIVGVVTAFNFPAAVWSWNALLGGVCGDVILWKPSSKTPLTAVAIQNIIAPVLDRHELPGLFNLVVGKGADVGEALVADRRIPLVSATGSCRMGRRIGGVVAGRLGRSLLELGGNNAVIVTRDADMEMAVRAVLFGALGTAGQRCTSVRRVLLDERIKDAFLEKLVAAYGRVSIGNPLEPDTLVGPLVDDGAIADMDRAIASALDAGGRLLYGGGRCTVEGLENGSYVTPAIMEVSNHFEIVQDETFAPLLYAIGWSDLDEALRLHNDVPQGLSSSIFTDSLRSAETFLSARGSDCGIANVNIGTSGAEIGGAFGGEKDTGGGRESGSDAWKAYMRRQTCTVNWSRELPLAQGVSFDV